MIFQKEFPSFDEFYGCILRVYRTDSLLFNPLNQYLRNEDWIELDTLLPYSFCFCKAFFYFKTSSTLNQASKESKSLTWYRGVEFGESALSHYDLQNIILMVFCYFNHKKFEYSQSSHVSEYGYPKQNLSFHVQDWDSKARHRIWIFEIFGCCIIFSSSSRTGGNFTSRKWIWAWNKFFRWPLFVHH